MLGLMPRRSPILLLLITLAAAYLLLAPLKQCADRLGVARPLNAHDCELALCFVLAAAGSAVVMAQALNSLLRGVRARAWRGESREQGISLPQAAILWIDTSPPLASLRI